MTTQLAAEVVLPELGEPDIPPVVLERSAGEVAIEACGQIDEISVTLT